MVKRFEFYILLAAAALAIAGLSVVLLHEHRQLDSLIAENANLSTQIAALQKEQAGTHLEPAPISVVPGATTPNALANSNPMGYCYWVLPGRIDGPDPMDKSDCVTTNNLYGLPGTFTQNPNARPTPTQ